MNSVHEQCPNSDPKQCTESKMGWVHSAHTQNPGRAHTARTMPRSWALLHTCRAHNQRRSRAQHAQDASSTCTGRALSLRRSRAQCAQVASSACAGRALSVRRSRAQRAQVATSFPCPAPGQVATPKGINSKELISKFKNN